MQKNKFLKYHSEILNNLNEELNGPCAFAYDPKLEEVYINGGNHLVIDDFAFSYDSDCIYSTASA